MSDPRLIASRIKFLRIALQEAVRAGDKEAAKRLTQRVANLLKVTDAPAAQARLH